MACRCVGILEKVPTFPANAVSPRAPTVGAASHLGDSEYALYSGHYTRTDAATAGSLPAVARYTVRL